VSVAANFTVVTSQDFVMASTTPTKSYVFFTLGREASPAVIDLSLFGGFDGGLETMTVALDLNGSPLTTVIVHRWLSHQTIVLDRINTVVPGSRLHGALVPFPPDIVPNTLVIKPIWNSQSDYLFVGPIVCQFHETI
jgi:hypothetical protein